MGGKVWWQVETTRPEEVLEISNPLILVSFMGPKQAKESPDAPGNYIWYIRNGQWSRCDVFQQIFCEQQRRHWN